MFNDLDGKEVGQIWAEARVLYLLGEPLFLTGESEELAKKAQEGHQEEDAKDGIIQEFLEMEIPSTWYDLSLNMKRQYIQGNAKFEGLRLMKRDRISAIEVWCECFNRPKEYISKKDSREINAILENLDGWKKYKSPRFF